MKDAGEILIKYLPVMLAKRLAGGENIVRPKLPIRIIFKDKVKLSSFAVFSTN